MKSYFISYSNEKYKQKQINLYNNTNGIFDKSIMYGPEDLDDYFKEKNKSILEQERGAGYWIWKPYIILKTLEIMENGDYLTYLDCGDIIDSLPFKELMEKELLGNNDIVLTLGGFKESDWTKRQCFIEMGMDIDQYWNQTQIEAGCITVKKSDESIRIIKEWQDLCLDPILVTDIPSPSENLPDFKEHRHDQSILSLLGAKYNILKTDQVRRMVICNV